MDFDFSCNQILINEQNLVHKSRLYMDSENFSDFIITSGRNASLYEVKADRILASYTLNNTILKGTLTNETNASSTFIFINIHFSYDGGEKELFFFIRIGDRLIILKKLARQFTIQCELQDVCDYELDDSNDAGNLESIITFLNGDVKTIELNNSFQKHLPNLFLNFANELRYTVMSASSNSFHLNLEFGEQLADYRNYGMSCENLNILSRFGDTWTTNVNNILLIGIPVSNCSNQKYLLHDLRVSLFNQDQKQLRFKHSIYEFRGYESNTKSLKIYDIYKARQHTTDAATNPEWTVMNNILAAGKSGIILIKLSTLCEGMLQSTSTITISYKIELPNKYVYEASTHVGRIEHRISQKEEKLGSINYFQDILTIAATTVMMKYQLMYDSDDDLQEFFEIFTKKLQFKDILGTLDSEDKYLLSTQMNLSRTEDHESCEDDVILFYCNVFGYWNGTMVEGRVSECTNTAKHQRTYEIKIYNSEEIKIQDLVKLLMNHFGSRMSMKSLKRNQNWPSELKYRLREEITVLEELSNQMQNGLRNASLSLVSCLDCQRNTDANII